MHTPPLAKYSQVPFWPPTPPTAQPVLSILLTHVMLSGNLAASPCRWTGKMFSSHGRPARCTDQILCCSSWVCILNYSGCSGGQKPCDEFCAGPWCLVSVWARPSPQRQAGVVVSTSSAALLGWPDHHRFMVGRYLVILTRLESHPFGRCCSGRSTPLPLVTLMEYVTSPSIKQWLISSFLLCALQFSHAGFFVLISALQRRLYLFGHHPLRCSRSLADISSGGRLNVSTTSLHHRTYTYMDIISPLCRHLKVKRLLCPRVW